MLTPVQTLFLYESISHPFVSRHSNELIIEDDELCGRCIAITSWNVTACHGTAGLRPYHIEPGLGQFSAFADALMLLRTSSLIDVIRRLTTRGGRERFGADLRSRGRFAWNYIGIYSKFKLILVVDCCIAVFPFVATFRSLAEATSLSHIIRIIVTRLTEAFTSTWIVDLYIHTYQQ